MYAHWKLRNHFLRPPYFGADCALWSQQHSCALCYQMQTIIWTIEVDKTSSLKALHEFINKSLFLNCQDLLTHCEFCDMKLQVAQVKFEGASLNTVVLEAVRNHRWLYWMPERNVALSASLIECSLLIKAVFLLLVFIVERNTLVIYWWKWDGNNKQWKTVLFFILYWCPSTEACISHIILLKAFIVLASCYKSNWWWQAHEIPLAYWGQCITVPGNRINAEQ